MAYAGPWWCCEWGCLYPPGCHTGVPQEQGIQVVSLLPDWMGAS